MLSTSSQGGRPEDFVYNLGIMSTQGVEFDEDKINYGIPRSTMRSTGASAYSSAGFGQVNIPAGAPAMVRWMMRKGIVKSVKTGEVILIGIMVINFIITIAVLKYIM
ncbi:MAG: hypothetical protein AAB629_02990 [Patescibacteria group bacterium]